MPPHVALYPPAKNPNVTEKRTKSAMLPWKDRPQKRKTDNAELIADIDVTVVAEKWKRLLSLSQPKKVDEAIPGILNRVRSRVADVCET